MRCTRAFRRRLLSPSLLMPVSTSSHILYSSPSTTFVVIGDRERCLQAGMVSMLSLLILLGADTSPTAGRSYHQYVALFLIWFSWLTSLLTFRTLAACRPSQRHQQACRRTWDPEAPPSVASACRNCTGLPIEPLDVVFDTPSSTGLIAF